MHFSIKRHSFINLSSTFFLLLVLIACVYSYKNAANWLYVSDPLPEKLDYMCSFAGDERREIYALQLYQRFSPTWIVSTPDRKVFIKWAIENRVDTAKLIITDKCKSTFEEISFFREKLNSLLPVSSSMSSSVGFVSSPLHMRRILFLNFLLNNAHKENIISLPVPLEQIGFSKALLNKWWLNKGMRSAVYFELTKMVSGSLSAIPVIGPWFRNGIEERIKDEVCK